MAKKTKEQRILWGMTPDEEKFLKSSVEVRGGDSLTKSILNVLSGPDQTIERLAFEVDPTQVNTLSGIYKPKMRLLPDSVLKRIAIQDSLVSNIVRARQNHVSAFGRPRPDRFSLGFVIKPNVGVTDGMSSEEKKELSKDIKEAVQLFNTCGHTKGVKDYHQKSFAEYLSLVTRDAEVVGRLATEIVQSTDLVTKQKEFAYFCHTDAGTIYQASPADKSAKQAVREEAYNLLCNLTGKKLEKERYEKNEYAWVQVIDGTPKQVFTTDEMKCANFYPAGNIELDGYPVTPIDTVISAVTTHINITTHNKVYFQSGRATRGMLIIKSDDVNPNNLNNIKQNFNASINGAGAAWRMPIFSIPTDGDITWQPMDTGGGRDMEFQYLTDLNAREILTAFMMSPDELPGWSYLSRGTNSQALSEGRNEFILEAGRDVGIRPLLSTLEDFVNRELFPLINPKLSKICRLVFEGLNADSPEKEIVNIQQNSQVWMTFNDILEKVEKKPLDKRFCSEIPLNPVWKSYLDQYCTVGLVMERFCGVEGASKDPRYDYPRDPLFFQWMQLQMQMKQMEMQQQQVQQAAQQPQQAQEEPQPENQGPEDLSRSINQAYELMTKSEDALPPAKRKILQQQQRAMKWLQDGFQSDAKDAVAEILEVAKQVAPRRK